MDGSHFNHLIKLKWYFILTAKENLHGSGKVKHCPENKDLLLFLILYLYRYKLKCFTFKQGQWVMLYKWSQLFEEIQKSKMAVLTNFHHFCKQWRLIALELKCEF